MEPKEQTPEQTESTPEGFPTLTQLGEKTPVDETPKKKKKKRSLAITILRIVISLIIIAGGIYLILFLVARAAKYDTIAAMLNSMFIELELMWQRIIY